MAPPEIVSTTPCPIHEVEPMKPTINNWQPDDDPHQARRIGKTLEELGELTAVLARINIQGLDAIDPVSGKTNRVRMLEETADVLAQIECNTQSFAMDTGAMAERKRRKVGQMHEWEALAQPAPVAAPAPAVSEHYDEVKATLQGAHAIMENVSKVERRIGPLGSHARGYTHKITAALRHLDALAAAPAPAASAVWENFPAYLIDHCEGETITEEGLQRALSDMLGNPNYASPSTPEPAAWCCEKGKAADVPVCDECAEASAAYSAATAPESDDTPLETGEGDAHGR